MELEDKNILLEQARPWENGKGLYIEIQALKPSGKHEIISVSFDDAYRGDIFEKCLDPNDPHYVSDMARFCAEKRIGLKFTNPQSACKWLGDESHYDKDKFLTLSGLEKIPSSATNFYFRNGQITSLKAILRVSTHYVDHSVWEQEQSRNDCDCALNFVINPGKVWKVKKENLINLKSESRTCTSVDCDISDYYSLEENDPRKIAIDRLIAKAKNGGNVTISEIFNTIGQENCTIRHSGPKPHKPIQNTTEATRAGKSDDRENCQFAPPYVKRLLGIKSEEEIILKAGENELKKKEEKLAFKEQNKEIPYEIVAELKDGEDFNYNGKDFRLHVENQNEKYGYGVLLEPVFSKRHGKHMVEDRRLVLPIYIPFEDYAFSLYDKGVFEFTYKDEPYVIKETPDADVFAIKRGFENGNEDISKMVDNNNVFKLLEHRKVKITVQDIMEMVVKTLKQILY